MYCSRVSLPRGTLLSSGRVTHLKRKFSQTFFVVECTITINNELFIAGVVQHIKISFMLGFCFVFVVVFVGICELKQTQMKRFSWKHKYMTIMQLRISILDKSTICDSSISTFKRATLSEHPGDRYPLL